MTITMLSLDNLSDGEVIIQRALLVHGRCPPALDDDSLDSHVIVRQTVPGAVTATDGTRDKSDKPWEFPEQRWPMCRGYFKALIILSPGPNNLSFQSSQDERHSISVSTESTTFI